MKAENKNAYIIQQKKAQLNYIYKVAITHSKSCGKCELRIKRTYISINAATIDLNQIHVLFT